MRGWFRRHSRTRGRRWGTHTKSYADIDSEEDGDVVSGEGDEDEDVASNRQARKRGKQKMKRAAVRMPYPWLAFPVFELKRNRT